MMFAVEANTIHMKPVPQKEAKNESLMVMEDRWCFVSPKKPEKKIPNEHKKKDVDITHKYCRTE